MVIKGKVAVITGAGRGIGRAIALEMSRVGARIVCVARKGVELHETELMIKALKGAVLTVTADVTERSQVERMVAAAVREFGRIDILINNAGSFRGVGPLWEVNPDDWLQDLKTNLFGSFLCCRAVVPHMIRQGKGIIINIAGGGIDRPFPGASGYACSKTGLMRLTDTLACELEKVKRTGVRVYAMDPGFIRTAMTEHIPETMAGEKWIPQMAKWLREGKDHPVQEAAAAISKLIRNSRPALSGRVFFWHQNFEELGRRCEDICARDTYQLRYLTNL